MSAQEFREQGKRVVDWIADYLEGLAERPVAPQVGAGEIRRMLPEHPPERGEPFERVLDDLERMLPGLAHWQHPKFFGYFPANTSAPAVLGELLSSGLGVQGMLWATSPACTELESLVVDWLAELLGLPEHVRTDGAGGGVIQDSASSASLVALLAGLHRASGGRAVQDGLTTTYTAYASSQTHSSIAKAAGVAGIGRSHVREIAVDADLAMDPDDLDRQLRADRELGAAPAFACATIGTTSTAVVDPIAELAEVCRRHDVWLHVDAAYAGVAAICPEMRAIHTGLDRVDSYVTDPHKWLLTNFDCSVLWVADREPLLGALSILPEYLRNSASESGAVLDYRDWQIPLGRRFRALKLWSVLRHYGRDGLREHLRAGIALAADLAERIDGDEHFALLSWPRFGLVCFRPLWPVDEQRGDELTTQLLDRLNASGELLLTHTVVHGRTQLRMAIGAPSSQRHHVSAAWQRIAEEAARLRAEVS
jgi:aromatic-L-amino-acid decarboxylase